ncbi:DUF421 domain-containing protein [Stutzerimonas azotifigens]|uniref:DUF421 domain-containing protein n=1 Tax=Stutzerimonas azotifigens TaxID=291995 RepID=A0ABR5YWF4_9GAMM|nr:YetF domain-containing protein [Stutzerimonas azotifigens]MBA1272285.1 DUF421 domain-containing protein [Stutzerimonas azotifigens]
MDQMFFNHAEALLRTLIVGVLAYISLVALLRISGRRTLSKMNAFDMVVTVALGSTLATVLLNKDVSLAQGVLGFATLIGLQYLVTWTSVRLDWVRRVVTGEPALLFYRGRMLPDALRKARVAENEVRAAVRGSGHAALDEIEAVILETDGSFSVVAHAAASGPSSLQDVSMPGSDSTDRRQPSK